MFLTHAKLENARSKPCFQKRYGNLHYYRMCGFWWELSCPVCQNFAACFWRKPASTLQITRRFCKSHSGLQKLGQSPIDVKELDPYQRSGRMYSSPEFEKLQSARCLALHLTPVRINKAAFDPSSALQLRSSSFMHTKNILTLLPYPLSTHHVNS